MICMLLRVKKIKIRFENCKSALFFYVSACNFLPRGPIRFEISKALENDLLNVHTELGIYWCRIAEDTAIVRYLDEFFRA